MSLGALLAGSFGKPFFFMVNQLIPRKVSPDTFAWATCLAEMNTFADC